MKIKRITIEGFGSIVTQMKYKFDRPGLNLILGANGIGKTTIFNALSWCLYGKLLKGRESSAEPWPQVLDASFRGTYVSVEFEGYEIIRTSHFTEKVHGLKKKGGLYIIEGGKLRPEKDNRKNQGYIINLLGYSFDLFKNTILFGQKLKRLLEEDGPKKKEIFDEAFESSFIIHAKSKVEERIKDLKFLLNGKQAEYNKYEALIKNNNELLDGLKTQKKLWVKNHKAEIEKVNQDITALNKSFVSYDPVDQLRITIKKLEKEAEKLLVGVDPELSSKELKCNIRMGELEQQALKKNKEINKVNRISDYCQECGQLLKGEAKQTHRQSIKSKLKKLKGEYEVIINDLSSARNEHKILFGKIAGQKDASIKLKETRDMLGRFKDQIERFQINRWDWENKVKTLEKLEKEKCDIKLAPTRIRINEHTELQNKYKKEIIKLQKKISIDEWLLKDPLSNSGLKAFIFDSMLNRVNHYLKGYTKYIGFGVKVYIDMDSSNKDFKISILRGVHEVPYDDLSGGEKQLADVALIFALNDTVTASKPLNILLMDEVFESLSQNNIEIVGQIIEHKSKNRSIHLITHQNFNPINCYKTYLRYTEPGHTVVDQKYKSA